MLFLLALTIILIAEIVRRTVKTMTAYTMSPNRGEPFIIPLADGLTVSTDGPVYSAFFKGDFLPASVKIHYQDQVYYIDPLHIGAAEAAHAVLITHEHADHFSPDDIRRVYQPGITRLIGPPSLVSRLPDLSVEVLKPGASLDLGACTITGVSAYSQGIPTHPQSAGYLGYLLAYGNQTIYHAGDTHYVPELDSLPPLTLAILPIKGGLFTMTTQQAADLVHRIRPERVFPLHYPLGKGEGAAFARLVGSASAVIVYPER